MERRRYLEVVGGAALAGLAGCMGRAGTHQDGTDSPGTDRTTPTPTGAGTPRSTPQPTEASADGWPSFGADPGNTGARPDGRGPDTDSVAWRRIESAPTVLCSPTVADGTVYTGSAAEAVHAFDAVTGQEQWRYDTGSYVEVAPAVAGGRVFAADSDGTVYALTTEGEQVWTHDTGHNLHSKATAVSDGLVLVGTAGTMPAVATSETAGSRTSRFLALDVASGQERWRFEAPDWVTGPAVGGGRVYAGTHAGEVVALDPGRGDVLWSWSPQTGPEQDAAVVVPPTYRDGSVLVGVHGLGRLVALDADTGERTWATPLKAPNVKSSPAVTADRVYLGATGTEATDYDAPGEETPTPTPTPETDDGPVSMPTYQPSGSVFAIERGTGDIVWRTERDHDFRSSPAVVGDRVYIGGGDRLYALDRSDGAVRWSVPFGDYVASSPAVAGGRAYIGSADGFLYCIGQA